MRAYDQGAFYRVTFDDWDSEVFASRWPCSTVEGKGSFTFASNGDLVDASGAAARGDGEDWAAFSRNCQRYGSKRLTARKGHK